MSHHLPMLIELIRVARKAVWAKDALVKKEVSRRVRAQREKKQFLKLYQATEDKLVSSLQSFFQEQVQSATKQMERLVGDDLSAKEIASKIYKPTDWNLPLANATFPVLVNDISKAALLQLSSMGYVLPSQQKSTASDWLEAHGVPIPDSIITDMPDWMVEKIEDLCETSFSQEFWDDVSKTTLDDLERVVSKGLTEGLSIPKLAKQIKSTLNDEYYHNRSVNIARTEAGSALNGARRAAIDGLMEEIGDQLPMKVVWLSVLGTTTREEHAHLDGVPADENGRWELAGKSIPWPGHWNLPASQRCNCQCTILVEYGMEEAEAKQLIADYSMRVAKKPGGKTLRQLVEKYRPTQPRVPAGSSQGGQWTDGGGGSGGGDLGDLPDDMDSLDGIVFDLDENDKSYEVLDGLKYNPNQPRVASGPQGGQWTAGSWSAAVTAAPKELHDAAGNPIPGNIGKLSKVDTSKWDANKPGSKAALKKIALFEKLAAAGSWGELAAAKESLKVSGSPNTYQKTTIKALDTLLEASKLKSVNEIPEKAEVTKEDTAVLSTKGWVQISGKLGTEEGGKFKGPDGKEYYVKTPTNPARAHNEVLASKLYEAFGANAIKCHLVDLNGKTAVASEWAKESVVPKWENPNVKADAARDFAVHALLGNWDVIGHPSQPDNCKYIDGKLTLVDAGGSLEFKASGGSGKKPYGPDLKDYDTLRNHVYNTMGGAVFEGMTKQQHIETMGRVVNSGMTPKKIQDLVDKYHGGTEAEKKALGKTITARMELMKAKYEKAVLEEKATKAAVEAYQAQVASSSPDQKPKLELPGKSPDAVPNVSMPPKPINLASMHPANQKIINKVAEAAIQWSADSTSVMEAFNSEITKVNDEYGTSTPGGFTEFAAVSKFVVGTANAMKATQEAFFAELNKGTSEVSKKQQEVAAKQPSAQKAAKAASSKKYSMTLKEWGEHRNMLKAGMKSLDDWAETLTPGSDLHSKVMGTKKEMQGMSDLLTKEDYDGLVNLKYKQEVKENATLKHALSQILTSIKVNKEKTVSKSVGAGESYKSTSEKVATKCNKIKATAKDTPIAGAPVLEKVGYWNVIANKKNSEFLEKNGFNTENLEKLTEQSAFMKLDSSYGPTPMKPMEDKFKDSLDFTQEVYIQKYTGSYYEDYNSALRSVTPPKKGSKDWGYYQEALLVSKTVMEKSVDLPVGLKLSRKYTGDVPEVGSVVADRGNLSTSYDPKKWSGDVHMRLSVGPGVKGCPVASVSSNGSEREIILPPNTRIYVTKVTKPTKQQEYLSIPTVVEAVILPTTSDQCCPP